MPEIKTNDVITPLIAERILCTRVNFCTRVNIEFADLPKLLLRDKVNRAQVDSHLGVNPLNQQWSRT